MVRNCLTALAFAATVQLCFGQGIGIGLPKKPPSKPADGHYLRVDMKGTLHVAKAVKGETTKRLMLTVDGKEVDLRFAKDRRLSDEPSKLDGKKVRVTGDLEFEKKGEQVVMLVCHVLTLNLEGERPDIVKELRKAGSALIGYSRGDAATAVAACKKAGLDVEEVYGTGGFLICRWPKGMDVAKAVKTLSKERAVTYIVPNMTVNVGPPSFPKAKRAERKAKE